jgi:gamma-glutamylcyclotransferase (GGCT)/AIG2-like uncharacterized protein YtfP
LTKCIDTNGIIGEETGKLVYRVGECVSESNAKKRGYMVARIYNPAKTAMQSGTAKTNNWVLEFDPQSPKSIDPLMGYTSSGDMKQQVKLKFPTKEEAVAYATRNNIAYRVDEESKRKHRRASYSDNFRFDRLSPWTH